MGDELSYTIGQASDIRVYRGMRWREYTWDGEIACECNAMFGEFGHDIDTEIIEHIKSLHRPTYGLYVYMRFGLMPKSGKSTNWANGSREAGLSVYEAQYDINTGAYTPYGALAGAEIAHLLAGDPVYLVSGVECGRGSDGEPVISDVKKLATLAPCHDGYVIG